MNFNVDLLDTDYRDENLLRAFDNISANTKYRLILTNDEMREAVEEYLLEILDINLEDSNMRLDFDTNKLYYEDVYESIVIFKKIVNHYGKGAVSARTEFDDYYIVNPLIFIRKMSRFALIKQTVADGFILYFDQADELISAWIYKYLKNKEEE